jgi:putative transcriptional regulator
MSETLKGRLLVATPALQDPNFDHTVVLILEHSEDGTIGVVLNRPTANDLVDTIPAWHRLAAEPAVLFSGGPVSPDAAICLGRGWPGEQAEGYEPLFGTLGTVDLTLDPDVLAPTLQAIRVFVGYSGWGEGQLEDEIQSRAWWVFDSQPDDALSSRPDDLWPAVLKRQKGSVAMYANFPSNPAMN